MGSTNRTKGRLGLLLGGLSLVFLALLLQLYRHPETAVLLVSLPSPDAAVCAVRCLGIAPFLQVLGETGQSLLLFVISFSFLYAVYRTVLRISRTLAFVDRAERKAVPFGDVSRYPFLENVTIFEDRLPLAFTGGFLKPRVFLSTRLMDVLDEKELRAVVLHEAHHQNSHDPLKGMIVSFLSDFLLFLPVGGFLKKAYSLTAEMAADAHSVDLKTEPSDLAGSLLKVRRLSGSAASWFFDPVTERARRLLGQPSSIPLPLKRTFLTIILLAVSVFVALVPVKKGVTSLFINHDKTCVLRSGHK